MPKTPQLVDEKRSKVPKVRDDPATKEHDSSRHPPLIALQNQVGNTAVQRLIAQASAYDDYGPTKLDDATAGRIHRARSGGQALDGAVQAQMSNEMGQDFSGVRVHTDGEAHALNEQLNAKAFTTGQDIFFRSGAYSPGSSGGQELLAHELTHVVQQSTGAVGGGDGGMRVNAPGDQFEQEADAVAKAVIAAPSAPSVQRQDLPEDDELQMKPLQRQETEDEALQMQELDEDESLQMQSVPDDETELS